MARFVQVQILDDQSVNGAIIITVASGIAMVSLSLTLLHILFVLAMPAYARRMSSPQERNFIMSPLGFYIICLFVSNLISSLGGILEAQWVGARAITQGPACTTQAFLLQLGNNATALWIAVISISALRTFMLRARSLAKVVTLPLIFVLWTVMIVFDGLASTIFENHSRDFFYGIAGMWCWITPRYSIARLVTQYIWMWVWSFVSAVCFILVFLSVRGNITVKRDGHSRSMNWSKRSFNSYALGSGEEQYGALVGRVGKTMCWFPITYITLTIPLAVIRLAETYDFPVPDYAFVLSAVNFSLLGIFIPALYFAIRHSLKHASFNVISDATLRGSFGGDKAGTDSFHTPQDKRPSPVSKFDPYPWTPTPTTKEWIPPSPHRELSEPRTPSSTDVVYATTSGGNDRLSVYQTSVIANTSLRQAPLSSKVAQRSASFHRPMASISSFTSSGTMVGPSLQLSPVSEGDSDVESVTKPQLALPPAAMIVRRQSNPSPNIISPLDLERLANIPLSPVLPSVHKRSETDASVYNGPRAISPDLNALLRESPTPSTPNGPPPPPRKARRSPIPSVPVDVDEDDEGSVCSAAPSVGTFKEDIRPMSVGDITSRPSPQRAESMRTFWAAYEEQSPMTPNMPIPDAASLKRDTMRTFWAAYEDPSPTTADMPMSSDAASFQIKSPMLTSPASSDFRHVNPSVFLKPSLSAVGRPAVTATPSSDVTSTKPLAVSKAPVDHRRSRSFTPMPTPPASAMTSSTSSLRSTNSATARFPARNVPTPTPSNHSVEVSYRAPRPQPGYL